MAKHLSDIKIYSIFKLGKEDEAFREILEKYNSLLHKLKKKNNYTCLSKEDKEGVLQRALLELVKTFRKGNKELGIFFEGITSLSDVPIKALEDYAKNRTYREVFIPERNGAIGERIKQTFTNLALTENKKRKRIEEKKKLILKFISSNEVEYYFEIFEKAFKKLPKNCQELISYKHRSNEKEEKDTLNYKEIAEVMDYDNANVVKTMTYNCRKTLKEICQELLGKE